MSTTTYPEERLSSAAHVRNHRDSLDPNPSAGVPFGGPPATAPVSFREPAPRLPSSFDEEPDFTLKQAARILNALDDNEKPTEAAYAFAKEHGYQLNGRGDWRIPRAKLDQFRGVAA